MRAMAAKQQTVEYAKTTAKETHISLSLLERDIPLTLHNITTHICHHMADQLQVYNFVHTVFHAHPITPHSAIPF